MLEILDVTQPKPPSDEDVERSPRLRFYKDTSVKPWQHERVLELLLTMLALTEPIGTFVHIQFKIEISDPRSILTTNDILEFWRDPRS